MIVTIIILVVIMSVLVFVHEFGHFATAKLLGIKVEEFGFGFPPRIFGFRRGDTDYTVNWVPLGGFVRIKGETGDTSGDKDSFAGRPIWQRTVVLCAGVTMNFLLAWGLMTFGYLIGLPQVVDDLPANAIVREAKVQVYSVLKDSPAAAAGLAAGDTLVTMDGTSVMDINAFREYTGAREGQAISLVVSRGGALKDVSVTPQPLKETKRAGIGVAVTKTGFVSYPFWIAPYRGLAATWFFVREIFGALGSLLTDLFAVRPISVEFSGPVGIAVITAEMAKLGFRHLLQFAALLSVNLAVINIIPFPALDGGRVLFLLFELARRGRAVSAKIENWTHTVGFALLMVLVIFITFKDVVKFGDRIWAAVGSTLGF